MTDRHLPLDAELLDRYLTGECPPEMRPLVDRWIAASPDHQIVVDALRSAPPGPAGAFDAHHAWNQLTKELGWNGAARPSRRVSSRRVQHLGWIAAVAAIAIGIVGTVVHDRTSARLRGTPVARTYHTNIAQTAVVTLLDGSRVTLAPQTTLTVAAGFGGEARTVVLTGEAYFDVTSDRGAPFIVRTGTLQAQVLGTTFDIRGYTGERDARVAVMSGRVAVSRTTGERMPGHQGMVVLAAGMVGRVTDSTAIVSTTGASSHGTWTSGQLIFRNTPVTDVLTAVGQWYGYEFRIADSALARLELTVTFNGQSSASVMTLLKTMLGASMTFSDDGRVVTLHANKRAMQPRDVQDRNAKPTRNTPWVEHKEVGR